MTQAQSETDNGRGVLCKARTKSGELCRFPMLRSGDGFCYAHSPATAKERAAASRKGGLRTGQKRSALLARIDFASASGVRDFLEGLACAVLTDSVAAGKAQAAAQIAQAALAVRSGQELGDRLDALEASIRQVVAEAAGQVA